MLWGASSEDKKESALIILSATNIHNNTLVGMLFHTDLASSCVHVEHKKEEVGLLSETHSSLQLFLYETQCDLNHHD